MHAHIFDADGVIFDSEPAHARAYSAYVSLFDIELTEEEFMHRFHGKSGRDIMRALFPDASPVEIKQHVDDQNNFFRSRYAREVQLIVGFAEYLERLGAVRTIIVSNGARENLDAMMRIHEFSLRTLTIEDFRIAKPDPAGYLRALEVLGVRAKDAVVYEDTPIGIEAARRAGIKVIGIASYHEPDTLLEAGAERVVRNFTEL